MFLFLEDDLTLPYTTNIYPLPGRPFLSRFVFRTSRLVGYVICDRSLEGMYDVFHLENLGDQIVGAAAEAANRLPNATLPPNRAQ